MRNSATYLLDKNSSLKLYYYYYYHYFYYYIGIYIAPESN